MSESLRFALFMIVAMTLWHNAGISSSSGGSESCRISLAWVRVCVVFLGLIVNGVTVLGLGIMFLAVFLSLVMRLNCRVSNFVMGGCSFMFVSLGDDWAMGHIVCARRW